ncbi:MAG: helix-turn-helix domain-containing protein [Patescibacteria group bacterium]
MARQKQKMDIMTTTLRGLDLGENEALLYGLMLGHPQSTVAELGTRAPYPRTMLYYVLKLLMQRGLVSAKKDAWRTVYVAEDPEHLYDLVSKKEREFERDMRGIRELIPRLKNQYRLAGIRTSVRAFEGAGEYAKALADIIVSKPKEIYSYEVLTGKKPAVETRHAHDARRITHKIKKNILFFNHPDALRSIRDRRYDDYTQFRALQEKLVVPFSVDLTLYEGKLLYTTHYDAHEPTATLIEDHALYEMQKNIFDTLWKTGKDYTLTTSHS